MLTEKVNIMDYKTINPEERNDIINAVCMYYARLSSDNPRYKKQCTQDLHTIASYYGAKYTTVRNNKDVYDAQFDNGRSGWHQRSITASPMLNKTYIKYKDLSIWDHEKMVNDILSTIQSAGNMYFSIKTKDPETVRKILRKDSCIEFDGLNVLRDSLSAGQLVFIVLGGDNPPWETGLTGMGIISQPPYDLGYEGRNFKVKVDIKLLLKRPIKRENLVPYKDTYGIIGIAPIVKWEPNQALSQIDDDKAIALMRAMLDLNPAIEPELESLLDANTILRIKGSTTMFIPVEVAYKEDINTAIAESLDSKQEPAAEELADEKPFIEPYTKDDFLADVFMDEQQYKTLLSLIKTKKNIILQGAPGVGKTYAAKRFAYSILGAKDTSHVEMVQFHQSYSYEDFVMGYRPAEGGFSLVTGPFYEFCCKAGKDPQGQYFFIIDEINRGNLSRIFGELLMLIEASKRNEHCTLLYDNQPFCIPANLYIIGMMNTADRSLAMIDYALRRRFGFFDMNPAFDADGFKAKNASSKSRIQDVLAVIKELNDAITLDDSLGRGFQIGHSYFCCEEPITDASLRMIVDYEIIPLLDEYWFDEPSKVLMWKEKLQEVLQPE